jgi:hypothetical protein
MVGNSLSRAAIHTVVSVAILAIAAARCRSGQRRAIPSTMREQFAGKSTPAPEFPMKNPEFYLILKDRDLHEELENAVFEAGFDDSELTVRGDHAAIWVCHREGELTNLVREALEQARNGGLRVLHVEMESAVFA